MCRSLEDDILESLPFEPPCRRVVPLEQFLRETPPPHDSSTIRLQGVIDPTTLVRHGVVKNSYVAPAAGHVGDEPVTSNELPVPMPAAADEPPRHYSCTCPWRPLPENCRRTSTATARCAPTISPPNLSFPSVGTPRPVVPAEPLQRGDPERRAHSEARARSRCSQFRHRHLDPNDGGRKATSTTILS